MGKSSSISFPIRAVICNINNINGISILKIADFINLSNGIGHTEIHVSMTIIPVTAIQEVKAL